jgi:hypothetical protein
MGSKQPQPRSSYCGTSIEEIATVLIETRFVQFHMNGEVVAASIGGSRRRPTLGIAVAAQEPHRHLTSIRPLKGTPASNFDDICVYLRNSTSLLTRPDGIALVTDDS